MQLVKTALATLAGVGLFCGSAFAGDEDADKAKRILDKVEKKLEQEREKVRDTVEKILDEEMSREDKTEKKTEKKVEKKTEKKVAPKADQKPYLGVFLNETEGGPAVAETMEGSPAEKAGLQSGDVILKVNGKDVAATPDVIGAVAEHKVGDEVKLEVLRGKENLSLTAKLAPRPEELAANFTPPNDEGDEEEADEDEGKEEGKPGPGPDELRKRIRKFMDRMREGRGDEKDEADEDEEKEEPKEAKKPKKGAKKLLDEALEDEEDQPKKQPKKEPKKQPKREPEEDEEESDEDSNQPDLGNFEELARRFMEELMQPREGEEGEEGGGADDPMGRIMEWFQSEEGQKMMEELQPMIEQLMQDENIQKMLEDLMQGQGFEPPTEEDEEEGEDLTEPKREEPKRPARGGQAYLGVSPGELTDDLRDQLEIEKGVVINDVVEDGPGAKAGLKKNDVILSIDGEEITAVADIRGALTGKKPGDEVEIVVLRKGKKKTITVELGKKGASLPQDDSREQAAGRAMEQLQQALQLDPSVEEAMKDFRGAIERRVQGRGDNVKKAVEDFRSAIEKARGTAEDQKNGQDPAVWMKQMAEFAKVFAKDKELYWNVTDKEGKVLWKQRLEPDKMLDLAARLGANEAQKAAQAVTGTKVTEWQCDEDCCKDKRTKGEETAASQQTRRELPQWRKEIRERIQRALGGRKGGDEGCEDCPLGK